MTDWQREPPNCGVSRMMGFPNAENVGDKLKNWQTKKYPDCKGARVVPVGRQLDNGRYRMGQRHIGRPGAEGEGIAVGMASQGKEASKRNEAST